MSWLSISELEVWVGVSGWELRACGTGLVVKVHLDDAAEHRVQPACRGQVLAPFNGRGLRVEG